MCSWLSDSTVFYTVGATADLQHICFIFFDSVAMYQMFTLQPWDASKGIKISLIKCETTQICCREILSKIPLELAIKKKQYIYSVQYIPRKTNHCQVLSPVVHGKDGKKESKNNIWLKASFHGSNQHLSCQVSHTLHEWEIVLFVGKPLSNYVNMLVFFWIGVFVMFISFKRSVVILHRELIL